MKNLREKQALPYLASINWQPEKDTDEDWLIWSKEFHSCPLFVRYGLNSDEVSQWILAIADKFNLNTPEEVGEISRIVREVFTRQLKEEEIRKRGREKLKITQQRIEEFLQEIIKVVKFVREVGQRKIKEYFNSLPLASALDKYPNIAQQELTDSIIERKNEEGEILRYNSTVKNWIDDYIQNKGAQAHSDLERGRYLFDSPNARKLSIYDRKKVSLVLRSYDKQEPLKIYLLGDEPKIYFPPEPEKKEEIKPEPGRKDFIQPEERLKYKQEETENKKREEKRVIGPGPFSDDIKKNYSAETKGEIKNNFKNEQVATEYGTGISKEEKRPELQEAIKRVVNPKATQNQTKQIFSGEALADLKNRNGVIQKPFKKEFLVDENDGGVIIENAQQADFEKILKEEKQSSVANLNNAPIVSSLVKQDKIENNKVVRLDQIEKNKQKEQRKQANLVNLKNKN